jgi:hypothetical protein
MKFWNNPALVGKTPLLTTLLLEYANAGQLYRMWTERTAAGQSLWSWISVWLALVCWTNFYRVICPAEKFALRCTVFGVFMNSLVILSVIYFRYVAGR